jgi:uncharacterized protein YwgA
MTTATARDVADIIGVVGDIVGKTKLQKTVALLELSGFGAGFSFSYYLYGPYSDELAAAVDRAILLGMIREDERVANWGGRYSVFHADPVQMEDQNKAELIRRATRANPVVLELAVTAAFLGAAKEEQPWDKLRELKPEKASAANVERAQALYAEFRKVPAPVPLPEI